MGDILLSIAIVGEMISVLTVLYMSFFGDPYEIFNDDYDDDKGFFLTMTAIFAGWITFPFFMYIMYKQIDNDK